MRMPMAWRLFWVLTLFSVLAAPVAPVVAAQRVEVYTASAPVADRTPEEREALLEQLLLIVLARVVGPTQLAQVRSKIPELQKPAELVREFSYQEAAGPGAGDALQLVVEFDDGALERLLTQQGVAVWGAIRPSVLVWLVLEQGAERVVLTRESQHPLAEVLRGFAADRGLPLVLPRWDENEQRRLQVADIWGGFTERIYAASEPYGAEAVLVGRLRAEGQQWQGRWILSNQGAEQSWSQTGSVHQVLAQGVERSADTLMERYAGRAPRADNGPAAADGGFSLVVYGIRSMQDYARVSKYLRTLSAVRQLQVLNVGTGQVAFRVHVQGGRHDFEQLVSLGKVLTAEPQGAAAPGTVRYDLSYRLVP